MAAFSPRKCSAAPSAFFGALATCAAALDATHLDDGIGDEFSIRGSMPPNEHRWPESGASGCTTHIA